MNSGSSFRIQRAGLDELEPVASLFDAYRVFYGQPGNPVLARAFVRERMRCGESVIFLACRSDAAAIGFTQLYPSFSSISASRAFILNDLFVVPEARRGGVAKALLAAATAHARTRGATQMSLSTAATNTAAQRLYAAAGWTRDDAFHTYHLAL